MKTTQLRPFLATQASALIVGIVATVGSFYQAFYFIRDGLSAHITPNISGFPETFRGVPNPGGSSAFSLVLLPVVATLCWWGIIADWKSKNKKTPDNPCNETKNAEQAGDCDAEESV